MRLRQPPSRRTQQCAGERAQARTAFLGNSHSVVGSVESTGRFLAECTYQFSKWVLRFCYRTVIRGHPIQVRTGRSLSA
jgi:hypothetical protein